MALQHAGPSDSEQRMYRVYDQFSRLLERQPAKARQLSKELEEVTQRYAAEPQKGRK